MKTYSELITLPTFEERFKYCQENQRVGEETFGGHRYLNQRFYHSHEWLKMVRPKIIMRDKACDLAVEGYEIFGPVYIHHLNPMKVVDLIESKEYVYLAEYLVCTSFDTHQALHYGTEPISKLPVTRRPNDTAPWLMGGD